MIGRNGDGVNGRQTPTQSGRRTIERIQSRARLRTRFPNFRSMPADALPLFRPDVLRPHIAAFPLADAAPAWQSAMGRWAVWIRDRSR